MAQDVCVIVGAEEGGRSAAVVGDRSRACKHVQRARIVLLSAKRRPAREGARRVGVRRPTVWRRRFAEQGVDGLLRDKIRPLDRPQLPPATVARVLALTSSESPGAAIHWSGRRMAKAVGISLRSVQRIRAAHRLQPHRIRTFKLSRDPAAEP